MDRTIGFIEGLPSLSTYFPDLTNEQYIEICKVDGVLRPGIIDFFKNLFKMKTNGKIDEIIFFTAATVSGKNHAYRKIAKAIYEICGNHRETSVIYTEKNMSKGKKNLLRILKKRFKKVKVVKNFDEHLLNNAIIIDDNPAKIQEKQRCIQIMSYWPENKKSNEAVRKILQIIKCKEDQPTLLDWVPILTGRIREAKIKKGYLFDDGTGSISTFATISKVMSESDNIKEWPKLINDKLKTRTKEKKRGSNR